MRYLVQWEIHIHADSPQEAAKQAFDIMQRPGTTATVFEVFNEDGDKTDVDLLDDETKGN